MTYKQLTLLFLLPFFMLPKATAEPRDKAKLGVHAATQTFKRNKAWWRPALCSKDLSVVLDAAHDVALHRDNKGYYKQCFTNFLNTSAPKMKSSMNTDLDRLEKSFPGVRSVLRSIANHFTEKVQFSWGKDPYPLLVESFEPGLPPYTQPTCLSMVALKKYVKAMMQQKSSLVGTSAGYELIPEADRKDAIGQWLLWLDQNANGNRYDGQNNSLEVKLVKKQSTSYCLPVDHRSDADFNRRRWK